MSKFHESLSLLLCSAIVFVCACDSGDSEGAENNTDQDQDTAVVLDSDCHEYVPAEDELFVDLSCSIREVTHCAGGSLYGITERYPEDIAGLVAPLHPRSFVQPPFGESGNQHPYGSAYVVAERLAPHTDAVVTITLADLLPAWPYRWPGKEEWLSLVNDAVDAKLASGLDNYYGYMIWNEPSETWDNDNGDFLTECWVPTYELLRAKDPDAAIIGPGDAYFSQSRMKSFLSDCKDNDYLPDIMAWHELQGSEQITRHVTDYREIERDLDLAPLPISINEYSPDDHEKEGAPGPSAVFIAKFERNKIDTANISWWHTPLPGRLGSLLTRDNEKGGGWWFYKWYGDMTGAMATVVPPDDATDGLDGFANLDTRADYASICLGGNYTGSANVIIDGIPRRFGDRVTVTIQYVPWESKDTPVAEPAAVSTEAYDVAEGKITVPIDVANPLYGYHVHISPE